MFVSHISHLIVQPSTVTPHSSPQLGTFRIDRRSRGAATKIGRSLDMQLDNISIGDAMIASDGVSRRIARL